MITTETQRKSMHEWYIRNRSKKLRYNKQHYERIKNNRHYYTRKKEWFKKYYKLHRTQKLRKSRKYNHEKKIELFSELGGKCIKCGFSDSRALQIDHIGGGGGKEHKNKRGKFYVRLLNLSKLSLKRRYQLLCANCNWIKRFKNNECRRNKK